MTEYGAMLRGILSSLKPGGRLVIIEPIHDSMRAQSRATQADHTAGTQSGTEKMDLMEK